MFFSNIWVSTSGQSGLSHSTLRTGTYLCLNVRLFRLLWKLEGPLVLLLCLPLTARLIPVCPSRGQPASQMSDICSCCATPSHRDVSSWPMRASIIPEMLNLCQGSRPSVAASFNNWYHFYTFSTSVVLGSWKTSYILRRRWK